MTNIVNSIVNSAVSSILGTGSLGLPPTQGAAGSFLKFYSPLSNKINPNIGVLDSFTHVSSHVIKDHEGLWRETVPGSASFWGGREGRNLFSHSNDVTSLVWSSNRPDSLIRIDSNTLSFLPAASNSWGQYDVFFRDVSSVDAKYERAGTELVATVELKGIPGETLFLEINGSSGGPATKVVTLTDEYVRHTISRTSSGDDSAWGPVVYLSRKLAHTGTVVNVRNFQCEDITGQSNVNPSGIISADVLSFPFHGAGVDGVKWFNTTNGNTVTSGTVTEAEGTTLAGNAGFVSDPSSTNLCANYNANPDSGLTGLTKGGSIDALMLRLDDTAALAAAGLSRLCIDGNAVDLDNTLGITDAWVEIAGTVANTNPHSISVWARAILGTPFIHINSDELDKTDIVGSSYARYTSEDITPENATRNMYVRCPAGAHVRFVLNQLEESEFCGLPIIVKGAAISTTPTTLKNAWPAGLVNDAVFELDVTPLAANQGQVTIASGYVDANNWFEIGHDGTNIYARKRIAGVNYDATKALAYVAKTTYNIKVRLSSLSSPLQEQGVSVWVDSVIGTKHTNTTNISEPASFAIGSMDGATNMLAAIKLVDVHSGSMTDAEVVAL